MYPTHDSQTAVSRIGVSIFAATFIVAGSARAQERSGEVTGNDVYVRSGPSLNHYTVCKVNAGDRVTIVGEQGGWYEILPPPGAFSYISGDFVDTPDDKTGVVNGNDVRVRAGSSLVKHKYTVQKKLSKGAQVSILGRNPDGFLRIVPPDGVTLWMSTEFVAQVPEGRGPADPTAAGSKVETEDTPKPVAEPTTEPKIVATPPKKSGASGSLLGALPPTYERRQLNLIDADVEKELAVPVLERQYQPLIDRYAEIAGQEEDEFARRYAQARIDQLKNMAEAAETIRKVRSLSVQTDAQRRKYMEARAALPEVQVPVPSGLDAQGELRVSALYPPSSDPRRYRLVDPSEPPGRTIGYVDVPADSNLNVDQFIGRYVGVRAAQKRLQAGGVNPVPIYLAREIILLQPTRATEGLSVED